MLRSRKCSVCKTPMCARSGYYYCPSKECPSFDVPQRTIETKDVLREGRPITDAKPRASFGTGCDVSKRATPCAHCHETVYHVTGDGAEAVVCKCGFVVRGDRPPKPHTGRPTHAGPPSGRTDGPSTFSYPKRI